MMIAPEPTDFIERYSRKLGKQITSLPEETMKALQEYPWPGKRPGVAKCPGMGPDPVPGVGSAAGG